jgi:hypothetical protein
MAMPHMEFEGLMTYPNGDKTAAYFNRALELFRNAGIPVPSSPAAARPWCPASASSR